MTMMTIAARKQRSAGAKHSSTRQQATFIRARPSAIRTDPLSGNGRAHLLDARGIAVAGSTVLEPRPSATNNTRRRPMT
jgi:hypothetical protein